MTKNGVSWKYYSGDRGNDPTVFPGTVNGVPILFHSYCGICDPLTGYLSIMKNPSEEAKLQNYGAFLSDLKNNSLPAVSFVRPFEALAGHPAGLTLPAQLRRGGGNANEEAEGAVGPLMRPMWRA
jgi:phospholipase C